MQCDVGLEKSVCPKRKCLNLQKYQSLSSIISHILVSTHWLWSSALLYSCPSKHDVFICLQVTSVWWTAVRKTLTEKRISTPLWLRRGNFSCLTPVTDTWPTVWERRSCRKPSTRWDGRWNVANVNLNSRFGLFRPHSHCIWAGEMRKLWRGGACHEY